MNAQPNFEKIKFAFYSRYAGSIEADFSILMEQISAHTFLPSSYKRKEAFKQDFRKWLDYFDIRQVNVLIDILNKEKVTIPKWIRLKQFAIDYNKHGFLDLIRFDIA